MAWTAKFIQDTVVEGEGTATALNGTFRYERRIKSGSPDDIAQFVAEAKEKFASIEVVNDKVEAIELQITTELNK